ncbi:MAG: glutamate--tRNA ligase [Patescibacteria group bacterium]
MSVRTRIAPSPTGYMHIGTLHTALFNYFFAKKHGGEFIIRIEDTDQKRLVDGAVENLLQTMKILGLTHDEGPVLLADGTLDEKGAFGPYVQSQRLELYKRHAEQLLAEGHAYRCFCTSARLEEMRAVQTAAKQTPRYDRTCLKMSPAEVQAKISAGETFVLRMQVPEGSTTFNDLVRGNVTISHNEIDDQVIMKTDGFPTYHLAVVVDDHLMDITHVLRGEEWLPSTPKQTILYAMFGWKAPEFGHVPLLLNADKSKLSKRQGDVAVEDYLKKGYLPQTLINFVGTLGFNPKSDQELYTLSELTELFDISRVNKGGAVLNHEKLDWMNHHYVNALGNDALLATLAAFAPELDLADETAKRAVIVEKSRVNTLVELVAAAHNKLALPEYNATILVWKKADAADAKLQLSGVKEFLSASDEQVFADILVLEKSVKEYISNKGLSAGNVLWPLRVSLSGAEKSASPFELLWALGKNESIKRMTLAIERLD